MAPVITVEEVTHRRVMRRFLDLPYALHRRQDRWAPPLLAYDRARLDPARNAYFDRGDGGYFLARLQGRPAGRITAHVDEPDDAEGRFGFFESVDEPAVAEALVAAGTAWLARHGCSSAVGPLSFTARDEAGVLVAGHDLPAATGLPWHPPWYQELLEHCGLVAERDLATFRLPAEPGRTLPVVDGPEQPEVRGFADPRLTVGEDGERITAVPDIAMSLRQTSLRGAWRTARAARRREWDTCVIRSIEGDPAHLVPALVAAAHAAGYEWVLSPWAADTGGAEPERVHRLYRLTVPAPA